MHPAAAFRWSDDAAMLAFVGAHAFARIFAVTNDSPRVCYSSVNATALALSDAQ